MSQRYVFWRKSTGEPYRGEDAKYAPTSILAQIGETATVTPEGGISWPLGGLHELELAAESVAAVIDPYGGEMHQVDAASLIRKAIRGVIRKQGGRTPINPKNLLDEANRLAAEHFRKPSVDYVLVSSLSIQTFPAKSVTLGGCEITAIKKRRSKYRYPDAVEKRAPQHHFIAKHLESTEYQTVKVATGGRTINEAVEKALAALSLLRGLWTLFGTYGSWTLRLDSSPRQEAIGVVHTGPLHTLHQPDGTLATDAYWFEPDYAGDQKLFKPDKKEWSYIEKNRKASCRLLSQHTYGKDVEELIRRYAVALDYINFDVAFLQMWSILEKMTDTVGASYDETIQRATWIFSDRKVIAEILGHLRLCRNNYVHASRSSERRDQIVYSIKRFVEPHLIRLIRNSFRVHSLREYGECLSLSTNLDVLREQRRRREVALRMLEPKDECTEPEIDHAKKGSPEQSSK